MHLIGIKDSDLKERVDYLQQHRQLKLHTSTRACLDLLLSVKLLTLNKTHFKSQAVVSIPATRTLQTIAQEVELLEILGQMKPVLKNKFNLFHLTTLCQKERLEIGKCQNSRKLIVFS